MKTFDWYAVSPCDLPDYPEPDTMTDQIDRHIDNHNDRIKVYLKPILRHLYSNKQLSQAMLDTYVEDLCDVVGIDIEFDPFEIKSER